ncbi:carboxymuconolactone decarboxylase family protein [Sporolactobacillus spathodeae]|uniref:Alkylhydroperoxidase/carboxymuconolactone decarboxylase family protein YurZ n=1 Tax=Sporolactobacillus spathodeae TaxID=1465502 RepID=A0ABS2QD98_9BACL|nr:carboxymuconolactone decarboxylase family protein [Sporolactobacillus spathodeae]MBM7658917.1 alkylhydroperoxidase/carboxymuconolactone decarboxylase family protein YurZ [Sporolactobacillus spathodeae]
MADALGYFKEVYGEVPEWVAKMQQFSPEALDAYTRLRGAILVDGALSRKEKELILVGINAARRYERSMLYHTQGAVDAGAHLDELAEILSVCVISRGLPAWLEGIKSVKFASDYEKSKGKSVIVQPYQAKEANFQNIEQCLDYYKTQSHGVPTWVLQLEKSNPEVLIHYTNLRNATLNSGNVPKKLKELVLVAINTSERYQEGVRLHVDGARLCGATDAELAECHLTALLTAGIPAWFEGAAFL